MALINCPECSKKISDKAPTCPGCGSPIALDRESKGSGVDHLVTTQATSKALKTQQAIGVAIFALGTLTTFVGLGNEVGQVGVFIMGIGLVWYIAARTRIWWHHE